MESEEGRFSDLHILPQTNSAYFDGSFPKIGDPFV